MIRPDKCTRKEPPLGLWFAEMPSAKSGAFSFCPTVNVEVAFDDEFLSIARTCPQPSHCAPMRLTSTGFTHIYKDGRKLFGLGRPSVTVMQPAESIMGKHAHTKSYWTRQQERIKLVNIAGLVPVFSLYLTSPFRLEEPSVTRRPTAEVKQCFTKNQPRWY
jgi:hypothetical protein